MISFWKIMGISWHGMISFWKIIWRSWEDYNYFEVSWDHEIVSNSYLEGWKIITWCPTLMFSFLPQLLFLPLSKATFSHTWPICNNNNNNKNNIYDNTTFTTKFVNNNYVNSDSNKENENDNNNNFNNNWNINNNNSFGPLTNHFLWSGLII